MQASPTRPANFSPDVAPGKHIVTLRKAGYEDTGITRDWQAGMNKVAGVQMAKAVTGTLSFEINPGTRRSVITAAEETAAHDEKRLHRIGETRRLPGHGECGRVFGKNRRGDGRYWKRDGCRLDLGFEQESFTDGNRCVRECDGLGNRTARGTRIRDRAIAGCGTIKARSHSQF